MFPRLSSTTLRVEGLVNRVFPGQPAGHVTTWLSWGLAIFEGSVQESNPGPLALVKLTWVQHSNHSATELHGWARSRRPSQSCFSWSTAGHVTTWLSWGLAIFERSVQESNPGPLALVKLTWVQHSNHSATELHNIVWLSLFLQCTNCTAYARQNKGWVFASWGHGFRPHASSHKSAYDL